MEQSYLFHKGVDACLELGNGGRYRGSSYLSHERVNLLDGGRSKESRSFGELVGGQDVSSVCFLEFDEGLEGGRAKVGGFVSLGAGAGGRNNESLRVEEYLQLFDIISFHTKLEGAGETEGGDRS